jgi:hypothetical protein
MRRLVIILLSIVVSGIFLWLALRNVDINRVLDGIRQADGGWILLSTLTISLGLWARAYRWYGLLDFKAPLIQTGHILNLGFLLNLLPLRVGEVARSLLITRAGVPVVTAATSVVLERMLDTLLVVIMLVVTIPRLPNVPAAITGPTNVFGIAVIAAFVVMVFFARFPAIGHKAVALAERLLPFLKRLGLSRLFDHALDGLKPLTHLRSGVHAIVWTLISWAFSIITVYAIVRAMNMLDTNQVPLGDIQIILLTVMGLSLAALSIAVPVSVAGLGPFQAALLAAGQAVGANADQSLSLGFLFHGMNIFGYALWGIIGFVALGVALSDLFGSKPPAPAPETS